MTFTLTITTRIPSPYQVELFDALAAHGRLRLQIIYEMRRSAQRLWAEPEIKHDHVFLTEAPQAELERRIATSDLVVFSGYRNPALRKLITQRDRLGRPWAFWGERPGFRVPPRIGRYYRRLVFPELFRSRVPIWGIGGWAVEGYRREFGSDRVYCNVPYFSRLDRFLEIDRSAAIERPRRILFSGSLIERKGVDLLVTAFKRIAGDFPHLELHLLGDGTLRQRLEAECQPLGARVTFHGFKQWAELPAVYATADILCAPSRHDGWGLIVAEALAAGLLVVSTDRTGAALDLLDRDFGWIVPAGEMASLELALRHAASVEGDERLERILKGRRRAHDVDIKSGVSRTLAALDDMLGGFSEHAPTAPHPAHHVQ